MALQEINVPVSFSKGLNTKVDSKQTMQGQLLEISNGVFTKVNAINQDPGYLPLPTSIYNNPTTPRSIVNGNNLNVFNGQLVAGDSQFLYSFSEITQSWTEIPTKVANSISSASIGANSIGNSNIGVARATNGLEIYTYASITETSISSTSAPSGIVSTIYDPVSDNILYTSTLPRRFSPNPFSYSDVFYSVGFTNDFYSLFSQNAIFYSIPLPVLNPVPNPTPIILFPYNSLAARPVLLQSATNVYIIYQNALNIILARYDNTMTLLNQVTLATVTSITPAGAFALTIDPNTGNIIVGYAINVTTTTSQYNITTYSAALVLVTAPVASAVGPTITAMTQVVVNPTTMYLYVQQSSTVNASTGYFDTFVYSVSLPALVSTPVESIFGAYIATQAFVFNSLPTVNLGFFNFTGVNVNGSLFVNLTQSVYLTMQQSINNSEYAGYAHNTPYTIIGKYSLGTAGAPLAPGYLPATPSQVLTLSNTEFVAPYLFNQNPEITSNAVTNIYNVNRMNQTWGTHLRSVPLGNNLNMTGGVQSLYDGAGVAETGYHISPWQTQAVFSSQLVSGTAPPSLTAGATYSYTTTYEWTDNYGNLHRSAPDAPTTGVAGAADASHVSQAVITVNGTALSESYKINNIQVVLWRTAGNGSIFYRVAAKPNPSLVTQLTTFVTFTDFAPDSAVQGSSQLYTTGGEVDNIGPISTDIIFPYKNRLIAVDSTNPYVWWYSKQVIQGFPVEYSDFFTSNIDMTGGPITAGNTMDDKLIFFKVSTIFYVIGDGPAPNGTANDFSYPQVVTSDVGCTNQDSIIVIPIGLMFQSTDKGIYLLDRSLQLSYIGAAVEQFNNIPVTSADLLPNTTQVRFTLNDGTILIYDYAVQQWSTHTTLTFNDAVIYKNLHTGLQPNGQVLEQIQGQWVDITTPNPLSLTTGWFEFANLQGYQRVKEFLMLLTSVNATSILVEVLNDFGTIPINTDLINIPANTVRQQYRIFPAFQKSQSLQVRITEIPTGASAGGLLLSGLSFTVAAKRGLNKITADRSFG